MSIKQILELTNNEEGEKVLKARNFLSNQDETMLAKLTDTINKWNHTKVIHSMMLENFNDLYNYIYSLKNEPSNNSSVSYQANRHMMNYLAMARLFIDKVEENIKENFSTKSEEYSGFKQLTAKKYDNKFSYRFLWDLRNYTQHYGLPIHHFKRFIDEQDRKHVMLFISPRELIKGSYNWKPKMLSELKSRQENINVLELIQEHIGSLEIIYQYNLDCYSHDIMKGIANYSEFRKENDYNGPLYYVEFKDYREYLKGKKENYKHIHELVHERLIKECLEDLEKYKLIIVNKDSVDIYRLTKLDDG